jgi:hypothetical protein
MTQYPEHTLQAMSPHGHQTVVVAEGPDQF